MDSTDNSVKLGVLTCTVDVEPVTHTSGQIVLTLSPVDGQENALCDMLVLAVPIGPQALDFFSKPPAIKSSQPNWAPSSYIGSAGAAPSGLALGTEGTAYQYFVIKNQAASRGIEKSKFPLKLTLTGTLNAVKGEPKLLVQETSKIQNDKDVKAQTQQAIPLKKASGYLLYIDSFYASQVPAALASGDKPGEKKADPAPESTTTEKRETEPTTRFRSGEPFLLNWDSNGSSYKLFQDGKLIKKKDATALHVVEGGIATDTTFVLVAHDKNDVELSASLTVTVSNPTYSPELQPIVSILKSTINGIDGYQLRQVLQTRRGLEPPVGNKLKKALAETSDERVRMAFSQYCLSKFDYDEEWNWPNKDKFNTLVNKLSDTDLKKWLLLPDNSVFRFRYYNNTGFGNTSFQAFSSSETGAPPLIAALKGTSDTDLKTALQKDTGFPLLVTLLETPIKGTDLQKAIQQQEDAALIPLFDDENLLKCLGHYEEIALRVAIADAKAKATLDNKNFNLPESPDTKYSLRVSNGNVLGNIVAQALSGDNSGVATLNFNGYFDGSHKQFNPTKASYRVGANQRAGADCFFIDTYAKGVSSPKLAFAITADGNVGIGTNSPIAPLHVNGSVTAADTTNKIAYFCQGSDFTKATASVGSPRQLSAYFEGGQFWVNNCIVAGAMNVSSDRRIKHIVGLSDCAADLALLKKIRVTDYTCIDKLANTDQVMKKVIAQEIQALLPAAVSTSTQALPNVYEKAARVAFANGRVTVTTAKAHELPATGGKMRLYTPANVDVNADATVVDAHTFSFASDEAHEAGLFVYGKFVDDFLSVDYDAVAMLNVSATQALVRQVDELHQQNAALHAQFQTQGTQVEELRAALHLLQQQVAGLLRQPAGVA